MLVVHAADLHIDSPLRGLGRIEGAPTQDIRLATRRAFVHLIDFCLERAATLLILAGDVFDGEWRDFNTGLFFVRQLARLRDVGARVVMIHGNHDAESALAQHIPLPEHVRLLSAEAPETLEYADLGLAVHGQSYYSRVVADNLAEAYPPPRRGLLNVGVLHTNAVGASEHKNYAPCTVAQLVAHGYDYWALGHVHKRSVLHERPWVVYPGNLQGRHVRETGPKGCTAITIEHGRISAVDHRNMDVLRWAELELTLGPKPVRFAQGQGSAAEADDDAARDTLEVLLERIRRGLAAHARDANGRPVIVRITISGATRLHARLAANPAPIAARIRAVAADLGDVWPEKIRFNTRPLGSDAPDGELLALHRALRDEFARLAADDDALKAHLETLTPLSAGVAPYLDRRPDSAERVRAQLAEIEARLLGALSLRADVDGELEPRA
ncbi:MAG: DNA repair exonuclease [Myxococcales bacterium]|nr:DNA repair exonuclease [Myxococcales bacterium]MCB9750168.1 DNA repair exonuclease [Myxococcales bacterium]